MTITICRFKNCFKVQLKIEAINLSWGFESERQQKLDGKMNHHWMAEKIFIQPNVMALQKHKEVKKLNFSKQKTKRWS